MDSTRVRGTYDVLPYSISRDIWQSSHIWTDVLKKIRNTATLFSLEEVHFPIIEKKDLFVSSSGEESDIVSKEMYEFSDKGGRHLVLRPEGTAPLMRALKDSLFSGGKQRLFYIGPMFRYDRPQKGRYRQHMQFGVEILGEDSILSDVDIIILAKTILEVLGVRYSLKINYINHEILFNYSKVLREYLLDKYDLLSYDSKQRFNKNIIRILDSKDLSDIEILKNAPKIYLSFSRENNSRFDKFKEILNEKNIEFEHDNLLVRGLDYYNGIIFEFVDVNNNLTLLGGGRYDGMLSYNGIKTPAIGFGMGLERVLLSSIDNIESIPYAIENLRILVCDDCKDNILKALRISEIARRYCISTNVLMCKFNKVKHEVFYAKTNDIKILIILNENNDNDFKVNFLQEDKIMYSNINDIESLFVNYIN